MKGKDSMSEQKEVKGLFRYEQDSKGIEAMPKKLILEYALKDK